VAALRLVWRLRDQGEREGYPFGMSALRMSPEKGCASAESPVKPGRRRAEAGGPSPSAEQVGGTWQRLRELPQSMGWLPFTTLVLCVLGLVDSA
jgi:hypothetical protein